MSYYFATELALPMEGAVAQAKEALAAEGFGVLTEIDVSATLGAKLGIAFRPYRILGACNPGLAYRALSVEDKIGTMLPCNVVVQEIDANRCEVAAVDPAASMLAVANPALEDVAREVRTKLERVIAELAR